ncbi:hypothetical protein DPMN_109610 [Dreissena polymorpha]|uniref:Uncharacterized protein n=1 Tax=Dreissena polymorpha TaxID=45954 RepID=A0A9D4KAL1_DREPO|nr:hypothetical protein DPMN_109610 [Dreissena polymorpha]
MIPCQNSICCTILSEVDAKVLKKQPQKPEGVPEELLELSSIQRSHKALRETESKPTKSKKVLPKSCS